MMIYRPIIRSLFSASSILQSRSYAVYSFKDDTPQLSKGAYIAPTAAVIGKVKLGTNSSVWFGSVIRGDNDTITIGDNTNIQENSVLHVDAKFPMTIGNNVTVGHMVMLHGCTVGDNTLIGIGSVILNGAKIGKNCIIGAMSFIPENKVIPDNSMVKGIPGKVEKTIGPEWESKLAGAADIYVKKGNSYANSLKLVKE